MATDEPARDRVFPRLVVLLLVLVTALPYLAGLAVDDPDTRFDGVLVFREDTNAYLAFARQASEGRLLLKNPFTPEPHEGGLMGIGWWLMGWVAALPGSTVEAGFHAVRLLGIGLLVLALQRWCERLFASRFLRRVALVGLCTGGGVGWTLALPGVAERLAAVHFLPLDTYAGLHPFFWMLQAPHFLLAQALFLFALLAWARAEDGEGGALRPALLAAAVAATRPFDALVLVVTVVLVRLARAVTARPPASAAWLGLLAGAGAVLAYDVWLFGSHPVFKWWGEQNVVLPPQPGSLAGSLGLALPLLLCAVAGVLVRGLGVAASADGGGDAEGDGGEARHDTRRGAGPGAAAPDPFRVVIGAACVAALGVVYAYPPLLFTFQALPAVAIPATLTGLLAVEAPLARWRARRPAVATAAVVLLLGVHALTSYQLVQGRTALASQGAFRTDRGLVFAFSWFGSEAADLSAPPGSPASADAAGGTARTEPVVLATPETCNQLPRYAPVACFTGYRYATVEADEKDRLARLFFMDQIGDGWRRALLDEHGIDFVFVGEAERRGGWEPRTSPLLRERFSSEAATIFEVVRD